MSSQVWLITGASSGIGAALALKVAKQGHSLLLLSRNIENLKKIQGLCLHYTKDVAIKSTDISLEKDCLEAIDFAIERWQKIDVVVNNAGISMRAILQNCDMIVFKKLMDTNFWGTVYMSRYALPHLLKTKGSLVGISSIAGIKALPARSAYSASKYAIQGFLESVRIENLKTGLNVLTICPGWTHSDIRKRALNDEGLKQNYSPRDEEKMMTPAQVADIVYKAIVKRKKFVVISQLGKLIYLLNKFFPNYVSKRVYKDLEKEPNSPLK